MRGMGSPSSPHPLGPDAVSTVDKCLAFLQGLDDEMVEYLRWKNSSAFADHPSYQGEASVRRATEMANVYISGHNGRLAKIPEWIKEGLLTREEALRLTPLELQDVAALIDARGSLHVGRELTQKIAAMGLLRRREGIEAPATMATLSPVLAELVVVLAAQQAELVQLREELARQKNANLAIFGKNEVLKQAHEIALSGVGMKGLRLEVNLEEERLEDSKRTRTAESTHVGKRSENTDTSGKIGGIAKYIASLEGAHKTSLAEMNQAVVNLTEVSRHRTETRSVGE